jgi:hypothetical protein
LPVQVFGPKRQTFLPKTLAKARRRLSLMGFENFHCAIERALSERQVPRRRLFAARIAACARMPSNVEVYGAPQRSL